MNEIKVLPSSVAELIAAGEVIENPLSVIKELIENAIDSGANNIEVEISDGGLSLIRVTDDGCGMTKENILLCTSRHATSKLVSFEDLFRVKTLGFRGEALASIVSVSDVEIISSVEDAEVGYRLSADWDGALEISEHGKVKGTTVVVRNLFANVPARLKFLKSQRSEGNKINQFLQDIALGYSDLKISLIRDAKSLFKVQAGETLINRGKIIWSLYADNDLIEIETIEDQGIKIRGFVGSIETLWHNRTRQLYFVNQRLINSKLIDNAIRLAFKEYIMQNRYPIAVLLIEVKAEEIDVNIHPRKSEIKFQYEEKVFDFIRTTVSDALKKHLRVAQLYSQNRIGAMSDIVREGTPAASLFFSANSFSPPDNGLGPASTAIENCDSGKLLDESAAKILELPIKNGLPGKEFVLDEVTLKMLINEGQIRPIGLSLFPYALCEHQDFILLLDQHAIHEKYIYEKMLFEYKTKGLLTGQKLLIPYFFECDFETVNKIESLTSDIQRFGYDIEVFGNQEIVFRTVPAFLFDRDFTSPLIELADFLSERNAYEPIFKMMACKSAIKSTRPIRIVEIEELLKLILEIEDPLKCPHGRPTCVMLTKEELEKGLKRRL